MEVKSTKKEIIHEYLIPLLIESIILFALMLFFMLFIDKGEMLGEVKLVGDEYSSPTLGRLCYFILSFVLFLITSHLASKSAKKGNDTMAFWYGFVSGILLWQSVGECSWHFAVSGTNFVPLESIASFPLAILFVLLIIYGQRHHSFDWGIWCMVASFACNWLGHYITIGLYPFVEGYFVSRTWNVMMSFIVGILCFAYSMWYLLRRVKTKRGRMLASLLTYIAIGIIALGIMEG